MALLRASLERYRNHYGFRNLEQFIRRIKLICTKKEHPRLGCSTVKTLHQYNLTMSQNYIIPAAIC